MKQQLKQLVLGLALATFARMASGDIVYDNSSVRSRPERLASRNFEYGEEIILAGNGSWVVTNFQFEYFGFGPDFSLGKAKIQFKIYKNDGPIEINGAPTPKTELYDSGLRPLTSTGVAGNVLEFHDILVPVPKNFTWTIQITGLDQGSLGGLQYGGLDLYQSPTIGSTYDDYWEKTGNGPGGWELRKSNPNDNIPVNFGCRVQATYNGPVEITANPVSVNIDCQLDTTAVFEVTAIGNQPITYQWLKNGSPIPGETSAKLLIPHAAAGDLGSYTVTVANALATKTSTAAVLTLSGTVPCLRIGKGPGVNEVTVFWSEVKGTQWRPQHALSLAKPITFTDTPGTPSLKDGVYSLVVPIGPPEKYFRLVNP